MSIKASLRALANYSSRYFQLPLKQSPRQYLSYMQAYLEDRISANTTFKAAEKELQIELNHSYSLALMPNQFGMMAEFLELGECTGIPLARPPKRVLTLGANIGLGVICLRDEFPDAELVAVEADPRNFELLARNLGQNEINAQLIAAAASSKGGSLLSLRMFENTTCSTLITDERVDEGSVKVPSLTIAQILASVGWDSVDLLKIDIEGAEDELLSVDNQWLTKIGVLMLEIHPNTTPEKIASYLKPFGFLLERHRNSLEPVYVAFRPDKLIAQ
jgi:FkbM family methyltransferase